MSNPTSTIRHPKSNILRTRARVRREDLGTYRTWLSLDGQWAVEFRRSNYGLSDEWRVKRWRAVDGQAGWDIVSRHRTRSGAFKHASRAILEH